MMPVSKRVCGWFLAASTAVATSACGPAGQGGKTAADDDSGGSAHALVRKKTPAFSLKLAKGGSFKPADAEGKVLVLDFWATWCGPCKASFPKLDGLYRRYKAQGVEFVGISIDETGNDEAIRGFLTATGATFPIALDTEQKVAKKYAVEAMPSTFVIDQHGVVRFVHDGSHGDVDKAIEAEIRQLLKGDGASADE